MGAESKAELQLNVNFNIHLDLPSGPFVTYTLTADGMSMAVKGGSDRPSAAWAGHDAAMRLSLCISPVSWTIRTLSGFLAASRF